MIRLALLLNDFDRQAVTKRAKGASKNNFGGGTA